jgi:hypothetical protein
MSSLLNADREAVADALREPEPQNNTHVLRIIAWLLFAIIAVGGAYLYFERTADVTVTIQQR